MCDLFIYIDLFSLGGGQSPALYVCHRICTHKKSGGERKMVCAFFSFGIEKTVFMIFLYMCHRRSPCLTSDQERSLELGSLLLSSFSSSYSSLPLGKRSNSGKTQSRDQELRL